MNIRLGLVLEGLPVAAGALWTGLGGDESALAFLLGASVSWVGTVILALRLRGLRGLPPASAAGRMAVNATSRLALVAAGLLPLLPHLTLPVAALYLVGFFSGQILLAASILPAKG